MDFSGEKKYKAKLFTYRFKNCHCTTFNALSGSIQPK